MQTLGMIDGVFRIDIKTDKEQLQRHGQDAISFLVSPNPGVESAPLARIASGGELSRISLCVQLATIESHAVPTLIFDEVDAGIGGAIAETVGQLLRRVGQHAQVLCVTPLAASGRAGTSACQSEQKRAQGADKHATRYFGYGHYP